MIVHSVSAMVVRFITRRYIGEYDPSLEKVYTFHTVIDNDMVYFDILDTAGQPQVSIYPPKYTQIYYNCTNVPSMLDDSSVP